MPLKLGEQVLGALRIRTTSAQGFSAEDVSIATAFAAQAAIALENARLHRIVGFTSFNLMLAHLVTITWGYAGGG